MKRIICCLTGLFFLTAAFSQKQYFVYLQSESEQPFFVKLNDRVFSSTASGYLIISKLHDSTYTLRLGFPDNKWPEQSFKVSMGARDRGFLVKNLPDRGWSLFDLQTLSIVMAEGNKTTRTEIKDVSPFTEVLSKAANDPSLKERTVVIQPAIVREEIKPTDAAVVPAVKTDPPVKKEDTAAVTKTEEKITEPIAKTDSPAVKQQPLVEKPKQPDTTASIAKIDTGTKKTESVASDNGKETKNPETVAKTESAIKEEKQAVVDTREPAEQKPASKTTIEETVKTSETEYKPSRVRKRAESSTTEGFGLTFTDEYSDGKKDTIRLIIPNPRKAYAPPRDQSKEDKKFLDITSDSKESAGTRVAAADTTTKKAVRVITCTSVAAESDFMKLRRRMAGHNSDDKMIAEASKGFRTRCFSVEQLKNLSTLFLNDAGKYKFFETAHTSVLDRENFSSLASELKDETYISRFRAMLR